MSRRARWKMYDRVRYIGQKYVALSFNTLIEVELISLKHNPMSDALPIWPRQSISRTRSLAGLVVVVVSWRDGLAFTSLPNFG